jgi:hypothetical protein
MTCFPLSVRASRSRRLATLLGCAALLGCVPMAQAAAQSRALVAHRAVYDLSLGTASGNNAPASATGRIAFDFTGSACEGWVMNFRQLTQLQPAEGEQRISDMRSSTFEDGEAKSFRFTTQTVIDGRAGDSIDGSARKSGDGALSVNLSRPARAKLDLDHDVVFPTEQIERILDAAHAGKTTLEMKVYDGSDTGQKVYNTLTVIGHPAQNPPGDKAAQTDALKNVKRWPVSVSYFDTKKADGSPDYVLSFELYDNGISGALKLDYGDFTLKGELTRLDLLPQKPCKK